MARTHALYEMLILSTYSQECPCATCGPVMPALRDRLKEVTPKTRFEKEVCIDGFWEEWRAQGDNDRLCTASIYNNV